MEGNFNFECSKADMLSALNKIIKAVPDKSPMAPLTCVKMHLKDGILTLTGYDLEIGITTQINVLSNVTISFLVNAKKIHAIVQKCPAERFTFSIDNSIAKVSWGKNKGYDFQIMPSDDYPELPAVNPDNTVTLNQADLKAAIQNTEFAASKTETKPILQGLLFDFTDGNLNIVGIDGFRLAIRTIKDITAVDQQVIIKANSLKSVKEILTTDGTVSMGITKKHAMFTINDCTIYTRQLEGDFHKYKSSLPNNHSMEVTVNTRDFLDIIDRANVMTDDTKRAPVRCEFTDGMITVSMETASGKFTDSIPAKVKGTTVLAGYNPVYLTEALKAAGDENVKLTLSNNLSPLSIIPSDDNRSYYYLVLPVRLRG